VASIAFKDPVPAIDGNAVRVLCRLAGLSVDSKKALTHPDLASFALSVLDVEHPGDHNQALMELGATVCLPASPRCPVCPIQKLCHAHRTGTPEDFPVRTARAEVQKVRLTALAVVKNGSLLLVADTEFVKGHWTIPVLRTGRDLSEDRAVSRLEEDLYASPGSSAEFVTTIKHSVLNRRYEIRLYFQKREAPQKLQCASWKPLAEISKVSHGGFLRKVLRALGPLLSGRPVLEAPAPRGTP
jgi:A/G-specific adenine glycosylase